MLAILVITFTHYPSEGWLNTWAALKLSVCNWLNCFSMCQWQTQLESHIFHILLKAFLVVYYKYKKMSYFLQAQPSLAHTAPHPHTAHPHTTFTLAYSTAPQTPHTLHQPQFQLQTKLHWSYLCHKNTFQGFPKENQLLFV